MTKLEALKAASALLTENGVDHDIVTHDRSIVEEAIAAGGRIVPYSNFITVVFGGDLIDRIVVFGDATPEVVRADLERKAREAAQALAQHELAHGGSSQ